MHMHQTGCTHACSVYVCTRVSFHGHVKQPRHLLSLASITHTEVITCTSHLACSSRAPQPSPYVYAQAPPCLRAA
jgi:hypothetical protein